MSSEPGNPNLTPPRPMELEARVEALEEQVRRKSEEIAERVEEANRLKSEFLVNMSHELQTPLNAIIGFAELIHDGRVAVVAADESEYLGDILTSSRYLLALINDVLHLPKEESASANVTAGAGILVLEDDDRDHDWVVRSLEAAGFSVEALPSGGESVGLLAAPFHTIARALRVPLRTPRRDYS